MFSVALRHRHYPFQALNELLGTRARRTKRASN
jgi:hypothetical protein